MLKGSTVDMNNDKVEVIKSNKGHFKIIHNGFMYTKHKSFNNVTRWRCAARGFCRGSIVTSNTFTQPCPKMAHSHAADFGACEMAKARYLIPTINHLVFRKEHFQTPHEASSSSTVKPITITGVRSLAMDQDEPEDTQRHFMDEILCKYYRDLQPMKQRTGDARLKKEKRVIEDPLPTLPEETYARSGGNPSSPCFLRTVKGALKLCDEYGYRFIRNRVEGTKTYWNCERKKTECKARAISNSGEAGVVFNEMLHNHLPPAMEVDGVLGAGDLPVTPVAVAAALQNHRATTFRKPGKLTPGSSLP